jgi:hypothetical protein
VPHFNRNLYIKPTNEGYGPIRAVIPVMVMIIIFGDDIDIPVAKLESLGL